MTDASASNVMAGMGGTVLEAVREAQAGRKEAFEVLVERYGPPMLRVANAIVGPHNGRDAAQEAFVLAWCELPRLRDPERFEPWLRRIVVNQCRKSLRTDRRRPSVSDEDLVSYVRAAHWKGAG